MINANKYTVLSTREVMMAVYSPSYLFFLFFYFAFLKIVEVHKKR